MQAPRPSPSTATNPAAQDNQALISLAILKVNWDREQKDYLDNFLLIVAQSLIYLPQDAISLAELQGVIRSQFGLDLSQGALRTLLSRARKRGFVRQENKAYFRVPEKLKALEFQEIRRGVLSEHEALVSELTTFARETYNLEWSTDTAEEALLAYIAGSERRLLAASQASVLVVEPATSVPSADFVVAKFVQNAMEGKSRAFERLETIVKGSMLANAIYLHDAADSERRFRNTTVFFDTRFIISALGYAGAPRQDPCKELLTLLYETGAELACFSHTVDEVKGILNMCAQKIADGLTRGAYGESIEYFLQEGKTESDILWYLGRLDKDIQGLRIKIKDLPVYAPVIDERGFGDFLASRIDYHDRQGPFNRDIASISATMKMRGLGFYFILEECRALFVTTNPLLVQVVWDFFMRNASPGAISPCMSDYRFANLLWLKKPLRAPDLPRKRLIADCYAAAMPSEHLWRLYLEEVNRLERERQITPDDVFLLRHTLEAKTALMDKTLGEEQAFVHGTVPEVLELVRSKMEGRLRSDLTAESERRAEAESALEAERHERVERAQEIKLNSQGLAHGIIRFCRWSVVLLLAIATGLEFPWKLPQFREAWLRYLLAAITGLFLILGAIHHYTGKSISGHLREIESRLAGYIEAHWLKLAGLDQEGIRRS